VHERVVQAVVFKRVFFGGVNFYNQ